MSADGGSDVEYTEFVRLRFLGGRFETAGVGMPVEMLADLVAYRELLLNIAKAVYRQHNPTRKRIPKRFAEGFDLQLREVRTGSRTPVLERPAPTGQLSLGVDEYAEAQRLIESVFGLTESIGDVPAGLPPSIFAPLRGFGRLLGPTESIEIYRSTEGEAPLARYDGAKRSALLSRIQGSEPQPFEHVVRIVGLQSEVQRVTFRLDGGETIEGLYRPEFFEDIKAGLGAQGQGNRHLLQGTILVLGDGTRRGLDSIDLLEDIEDDLRGFERAGRELFSVSELAEGWLDGDGQAVSQEQADAAHQLLRQLQDDRYPAPTVISATLDGAVRLEWHRSDRITTIDIEDNDEVDVVSTERDQPSWIRSYTAFAALLADLDEIGLRL